MATRGARSTPRQRESLVRLREDLQEAFDSLPGRFWATRSQIDAYNQVLHHLTNWLAWEEDEDD